MSLKINLVVILLLSVLGCKQEVHREYHPERENLRKDLVEVNKTLVEKDKQRIQAYIDRRNWDMKQTKTGLWYMKTAEGHGDSIKNNMLVHLNYQVELLDGTYCYSSDSLGVKTFQVGKGGVERGLEELVLYMKQGDKAIAILPPHLAHGLIGDENRIPARAIIVYTIEILTTSDTL